jgi:hypothetical protein
VMFQGNLREALKFYDKFKLETLLERSRMRQVLMMMVRE